MTDTRLEEIAVKPLEWDEHPDGEGFYAFSNDAGDALYALDLMESGRWRMFIGGALVGDPDDDLRPMKWDTAEAAKAYAQEDLDGRLRRILSALTPAPVAGWRDMDSAPKDGSTIMVYLDGSYLFVSYEKDEDDLGEFGWYTDEGDWLGGVLFPSHWIPLPPAPGEPATEQETLGEIVAPFLPDSWATDQPTRERYERMLSRHSDAEIEHTRSAIAAQPDMGNPALRSLAQEDE